VIELADQRVAKFPDSSLPYVYKGILYMNDRKFDEAIAEYAKVKADNSPIYLNAVFNSAVCKYNKASEFN
jgi:tetratricopeptide (TPR) repeat protein